MKARSAARPATFWTIRVHAKVGSRRPLIVTRLRSGSLSFSLVRAEAPWPEAFGKLFPQASGKESSETSLEEAPYHQVRSGLLVGAWAGGLGHPAAAVLMVGSGAASAACTGG